MPTEQIGTSEDQRWSITSVRYVVGALVMVLIVLPCLCMFDRVFGWVKTQFATICLRASSADLLNDLDLARHNATLLIGPEEEGNPFPEWDTYTLAARRCREANVSPWRIRLAGGAQIMQIPIE